MELRIDEKKNICTIQLSGKLNKKMILDAFDLAVSDVNYKEGMGRLWDFRDADLSSFNIDTIRDMAQYSQKFSPGINDVKVSFLVSRDLEFGLSRMFEMLCQGKTPIMVFRTMNECEEWMMD